MRPVTVLVVDDSALTRRALRAMFEADPAFEVVGEAANGREALELALRLGPSLITMDLEMPEMDGLTAIQEIMAQAPTPILVVTGHPRYRGVDVGSEAVARGALEVVRKPSAWPGTPDEQARLRGLARRLATVPVLPHVEAMRTKRRAARAAAPITARGAVLRSLARARRATARRQEIRLVAVGASTGGPGVLKEMLLELPADLPASIVIVQHMAETPADRFVKWLAHGARIQVREGIPGTRMEPGVAYVALRGPHVTVSARGRLDACHEPPRDGNCPSVDVLFESVAATYGAAAAGVLLTGMGRDGARGLLRLREAGGVTLVQDEVTSSVFGMPKTALELGAAQMAVARQDLAKVLVRLVRGRCRTGA
ncbi:MAG TPA: chemotaxis-specific protein-glutamate methyltransferase CheB [Kofleriaceae bacterium]|nr:chemotaxis-specific protein-glutamate methyltransferase CheB [Kofleriaceae bacterium]